MFSKIISKKTDYDRVKEIISRIDTIIFAFVENRLRWVCKWCLLTHPKDTIIKFVNILKLINIYNLCASKHIFMYILYVYIYMIVQRAYWINIYNLYKHSSHMCHHCSTMAVKSSNPGMHRISNATCLNLFCYFHLTTLTYDIHCRYRCAVKRSNKKLHKKCS